MILVWLILAVIACPLGPLAWFAFWALVIVASLLRRKPETEVASEERSHLPLLWVVLGLSALAGVWALIQTHLYGV